MTTKVPFLDLGAQYQSIKNEINNAVIDVLGSSTYVLGNEVDKFEEEFCHFQGADFGVAVNTGTSALHLALLAAGVGIGDEVIVPAMTFVATAAAISYTGATPVFVDVDSNSLTLDPSMVEKKISNKTKAIIPVHLYGQAADMDPIMELARNNALIVIEDAAQAHAAEYKGRRVGSIGDMGAFSFYPGKNLGAYGEGGLVTTNNASFATAIKLLRDWGQHQKYHHEFLAYNYRMDTIQGAILRIKLRHLDNWTKLRRFHAQQYDKILELAHIERSKELAERKHVYHIYSIFHSNRDLIKEELLKEGISTGLHYPIPVHLQKMYQYLGYKKGDFPVAEKIANEQLSLPMFAELTISQIDSVTSKLTRIASEVGSIHK